MKPSILIHSVESFSLYSIDDLVSVLNKLYNFANFKSGNQITEINQHYGSYLHNEVINRIQKEREKDISNQRSACVGVTSVQIDCDESLIIRPRIHIAIIGEFNWPEQEDSEVILRLLYVLLQSTTVFITGNICGQNRCISNTTTSYSKTLISNAHICQDCRKKIINRINLSGLIMIEKALSRLKIIAINNYSFEQLKVINFEDQQYVFNSEFELIIDEFSIKRWLMQKWGFDFLKPQCFFSLTSALYKAVTSSGDKSEWMQAVNEMLERTRLIDTLLYLTKKRHRDHSRHQFYVAGIGLFFLNSKIRRNESIVGYLTRVLNNKYKSDKIWTEHSIAHSWIVSSLLHDSAYALSHVLEMVANAFQEESAITSIDFELITAILKQSNIFSEKWAGWVSHIKNDFDLGTRLEYSEVTESLRQELVQSFQPYFNYLETKGIQRQSIAYILNEAKLKPSLIFDHGIWSAANLINLLSELKPGWTFIKTLSDKEAAIMAEVVEAIALHNIALHDYGVTFKHNPIACFLRFCDQIQEWNRGTWAEGKFMEEMNHIGVSPVLEIAGQTYIDNGIEICFEYQQTDKLFEAEWDLEKFIKPKKQLQIIDFPIRISYRISMPFVSPSLS